MNRGPAPYINTVPAEGTDPMIKQVPFHTNAIGANSAGMPDTLRKGGMELQHYGTSASGADAGGK